MSADAWMHVITAEYLHEYLPAGGSAVKVVSGNDECLAKIQAQLSAVAEETGLYYVAPRTDEFDANGKRPDLHRIDKLFFAITASVPWVDLAIQQVQGFLASKGIEIRGRALDDLEGIASDNGRDANDLVNEYQRELATPQIRDHEMAIEFRTALLALQRAQLVPDSYTPSTTDILLHWLSGQTATGQANALKRLQIYERINQTNARYMLMSFLRWVRKMRYNGSVICLDFRPYESVKISKAQRDRIILDQVKRAIAAGASHQDLEGLMAEHTPVENRLFYSKAAYMQMLSMMRRFIDEIDQFEGLLLVVLTSPAFYEPLSPRRYTDYDALQTRIGLEVRDRDRPNPAAALVHLEVE
ncbi:MAG: DUF2791 family P-loop domain-containing protein [Armatimonadetes bacterium]|nr:DUF2791 family P-loop domain-containing protein [Armatimonadota bacterium]